MKKFLAIILAALMVLMCAACGAESEDAEQTGTELTSIPLGGSLGEIQTSEISSLGTYVEIEATDFFIEEDSEAECHVYYSEKSDTPYVVTYRMNGEGKSLEDMTSELAKEYGKSEAQTTEYELEDGSKLPYGYYTNYGDFDGELGDGYFYIVSAVVADGDEFLEIDYYGASEEFQLGDSNKYVWIPKGMDDILTDEEQEHDTILFGEYSEDYGYPEIWISKNNLEYSDFEWTWSEFYPDGLPFTVAQYEEWGKDGWSAEANQAFYDSLGAKDLNTYSDEIGGCTVNRNYAQIDNTRFADIYIYIPDGDEYNIWLASEEEPYYQFGEAIAYSLHKK